MIIAQGALEDLKPEVVMAEGTNRKSSKARKGRPSGAKLTDEQKRQIISFVEAGGSVDAAVQAAGISLRTFRELRQRSRGQHPARSALPHLKPFFEDLDRAIGRRLLTNEIWLSDNDPKSSLKYLFHWRSSRRRAHAEALDTGRGPGRRVRMSNPPPAFRFRGSPLT
jgi:hypothetical protein